MEVGQSQPNQGQGQGLNCVLETFCTRVLPGRSTPAAHLVDHVSCIKAVKSEDTLQTQRSFFVVWVIHYILWHLAKVFRSITTTFVVEVWMGMVLYLGSILLLRPVS